MVLEIGPCSAQEMLKWTKFARRIACELRTSSGSDGFSDGQPGSPSWLENAMISQWTPLIESWQTEAQSCAAQDRAFRWISDLEPAMVEFLLDGLNRCVHSTEVAAWCSADEKQAHLPMTTFVLGAFVTALEVEAGSCQQYTDQVRTSLVGLLPDF